MTVRARWLRLLRFSCMSVHALSGAVAVVAVGAGARWRCRPRSRPCGAAGRALIGTAVGTTGQLDGGTARDRPPWDSGRSNAAQAPLASYWARFAPMGGGLGRTDAMNTCLRCCSVTCAPPREPQNRSIARRSRQAAVHGRGWQQAAGHGHSSSCAHAGGVSLRRRQFIYEGARCAGYDGLIVRTARTRAAS